MIGIMIFALLVEYWWVVLIALVIIGVLIGMFDN